MISPEKCPYCFRQLGTWLKDPIFLPNGGPYIWTSDTEIVREDRLDHRFYKGCYHICEPEVQEIQDFLKQSEIDNGIIPLTIWSSLSLSGKFQVTGKHIKEMRDSVEKLLTLFGLTKTDYFNYDEEGNKITSPTGDKLEWTDPITSATDLQKFQVKYIHIEDLRHYIKTHLWQWRERFLELDTPWSDSDSFSIIQPFFAPQLEPHSCINYWEHRGFRGLDGHQWVNGTHFFTAEANINGGAISASSSISVINGGITISAHGTATGRHGYSEEHGWYNAEGSMYTDYYVETYNTYLPKTITNKTDFNITGSWNTPNDTYTESYFYIIVILPVPWSSPYYSTIGPELWLVFYSGITNKYGINPWTKYIPISTNLNIYSVLISLGFNPIYFKLVSRLIINGAFGVGVGWEEHTAEADYNVNVSYLEFT